MAAGQLELASVRTAAVSPRPWPVRQVAQVARSEGRATGRFIVEFVSVREPRRRRGRRRSE
jgi:hypothetical protein